MTASVLLAAVAAAGVGEPDRPAPDLAALTAPGVSLELARHRAATLGQITYDLAFHLPGDRDRPIAGTLELHFHREDDGPLVLDFATPSAVHSVEVDGRPVAYEAIHNHLVVPASALRRGPNAVRLRFTAGDGPLNRHEDFLYTLFVPARAHEAFPSFDQPNIKARFRLRLTVPAEWEAVANGDVAERVQEGDVVVYRFAETSPIPTYLFSFAAGRFQVEEAVRDGRRMRLFHRETDRESVDRNLAAIFDLHGTSLAWLEEYTAIPYPFGKFDFVAVPAFQYNGMEHPGAILYRASSLFLDETATRNDELGRASLIAHETAHMWFGNLVTMTWFDDVWMKEVFANFMAARIVHPSFPDMDHELRFLLAHYPAAYGVDRTAGANPIRQELANLDDAASLYGAIIYQKAPIVMRQLERLTGAEAFRTAVRRYLDRHAFGNADWPDLVRLLDEVAPMDVEAWSRVWVDEPGRPTVVVERSTRALRLRQEDPRGRGLVWEQEMEVRALHGAEWLERPVVLGPEPTAVALPPGLLARGGPVLPNGAGVGYGLFLMDDVSRETLLASLPHLPDPLARAVAWLNLQEMMMEGQVAPEAMLELAGRMVDREPDELVAQAVLGDLPDLFWRWVDDDARQLRAGHLETLLWSRLQDVDGASRKAAVFNAWRAIASTPQAVQRMEALWRGELVVPGLALGERDLTSLAFHLAVRDADDAIAILDAQEERIENPDRNARFRFIRDAVHPDPHVRDAFFRSLAEPANRDREEWVIAALQYLNHPLRAGHAVRYLRPALDLLQEVRETGDIFFPKRWLDATLNGHSSDQAAAIVRSFVADAPADFPPRLMGQLLASADPLFRIRPASPAREVLTERP